MQQQQQQKQQTNERMEKNWWFFSYSIVWNMNYLSLEVDIVE